MAEDLDILQGKVTESNFAGKAFVTFKQNEFKQCQMGSRGKDCTKVPHL